MHILSSYFLIFGVYTCYGLPFFLQQSNLPSKSNELILISGCTGTGKSTFSMEIAISRGILKCISTDTIRQVMRINEDHKDVVALHRASYGGNGDPIINWHESCNVLQDGIDTIVEDSLRRGTSLVLQGVLVVPSKTLIDKWTAGGGTAIGAVLSIPNKELHQQVIYRRGEATGQGSDVRLNNFNRIRAIHDETVRLAQENDWLVIKQVPQLEPRAMDILNEEIHKKFN